MRTFKTTMLIFTVAFAVLAVPAPWAAETTTPMLQNNCLKCHQNFKKMENVMAGNLSSKSLKSMTLQLKINNRMELLKLTADTQVKNIPELKALKGSPAMRVHYKSVGKDKVATKIVVKPKIKVPENQLLKVNELAELVEQGPEKGNYTLVDSRPGAGFQKGHIPTAISIPFPMMKKMTDKLPKDKNQLLVFYCEGYR